jgi:hypothetical protein
MEHFSVFQSRPCGFAKHVTSSAPVSLIALEWANGRPFAAHKYRGNSRNAIQHGLAAVVGRSLPGVSSVGIGIVIGRTPADSAGIDYSACSGLVT